MEPRGHKASPPTTAAISSLAIWLSSLIRAGHQVNPTPAMVSLKLLMQRILYGREEKKHVGHALHASVRILLVVSRVFHIDSIAGFHLHRS